MFVNLEYCDVQERIEIQSEDKMNIESSVLSNDIKEKRILCALIYVTLQEHLRKKHQKNEFEDHRIKMTKDFIDIDKKRK
jgi:hypothetical protein